MERIQYNYCYKEKENGWLHHQTAKINPHNTAMHLVPEEGGRKRGRPKKTWRSSVKEHLEEIAGSWHGARRMASDRDRWRIIVARWSERSRRP